MIVSGRIIQRSPAGLALAANNNTRMKHRSRDAWITGSAPTSKLDGALTTTVIADRRMALVLVIFGGKGWNTTKINSLLRFLTLSYALGKRQHQQHQERVFHYLGAMLLASGIRPSFLRRHSSHFWLWYSQCGVRSQAVLYILVVWTARARMSDSRGTSSD